MKKHTATAAALAVVLPTVAIVRTGTAEVPRGGAEAASGWNDSWPKFRTGEYLLTGALLAGTAAAFVLLPEPDRRWRGDNGFDESVRDALRLDGTGGRKTVAALSDTLFYGLLAYPLLVDPAVTWAGHGRGHLAWQMAAIGTEVFGLAGALSLVTEQTGRERPFVRTCAAAGPTEQTFPPCDDGGKYQSFVSGHTLIAFTGAGLVCVHHQHLPLYGGGMADRLACGAALTAAAGTGLFRIMADKHHATDVLPAAALGLAAGYLVPSLLHYGRRAPVRTGGERSVRWLPLGAGGAVGLSALGRF
jgi:membrane-associated phospholipid phosphatase